MKLHEDTKLFKDVIDYVSLKSKISGDIIEKDYYVCLMLSEISEKQKDIPMAFKGGTALYKISNEMRRFSEDIDLTVDIRNLSGSQAKRMLEKASTKFESLKRLKGDNMEENRKGSITAVYGYDSVYPDKADQLQRFGKIKIESTSFTVSEPIQKYQIEPLICKYLDFSEKERLAKYQLGSFNINTISLERMFVDKMLAAEFYLERKLWFDVAKHLYDISFMYDFPEIQKILNNSDDLIRFLSYKRAEETERKGSDLVLKPLNEFSLYTILEGNVDLKRAYENMQDIYVFQDRYKISVQQIQETLDKLRTICCFISDKEKIYLHSADFENFVHQALPDSYWTYKKKGGEGGDDGDQSETISNEEEISDDFER